VKIYGANGSYGTSSSANIISYPGVNIYGTDDSYGTSSSA
jgi:hypothetical protein